jgi:hypothetical protein
MVNSLSQKRPFLGQSKKCLKTTVFGTLALDTVAIERERYGGVEFRHAQVPKDLGGRRLLAYFPETNLYNGSAEIHTDGFLDADNLPG